MESNTMYSCHYLEINFQTKTILRNVFLVNKEAEKDSLRCSYGTSFPDISNHKMLMVVLSSGNPHILPFLTLYAFSCLSALLILCLGCTRLYFLLKLSCLLCCINSSSNHHGLFSRYAGSMSMYFNSEYDYKMFYLMWWSSSVYPK